MTYCGCMQYSSIYKEKQLQAITDTDNNVFGACF